MFECFEKYGGISSPLENQRNINFLKKKLEQSEMELEKKLEQRELEIQELNKKLNRSKIEIQVLNTKLNQSKTEILQLKKKTIDLPTENVDSKIYKWIAIVLIILFVLFILYKFFPCQKLKNIIQKKRPETRTMSLTRTENGDQATMSERKSDGQQKEENYDEDHSKREKREEVGIKYRSDYVHPEENGDGEDEGDDIEIEGLSEELHTNIRLKRKPRTSAVIFESEAH